MGIVAIIQGEQRNGARARVLCEAHEQISLAEAGWLCPHRGAQGVQAQSPGPRLLPASSLPGMSGVERMDSGGCLALSRDGALSVPPGQLPALDLRGFCVRETKGSLPPANTGRY